MSEQLDIPGYRVLTTRINRWPEGVLWRDRRCAVGVHDRQGDRVGQHTGSRLRKLCSGANEGNAHCMTQNHTKIVGGGKNCVVIYDTETQY